METSLHAAATSTSLMGEVDTSNLSVGTSGGRSRGGLHDCQDGPNEHEVVSPATSPRCAFPPLVLPHPLSYDSLPANLPIRYTNVAGSSGLSIGGSSRDEHPTIRSAAALDISMSNPFGNRDPPIPGTPTQVISGSTTGFLRASATSPAFRTSARNSGVEADSLHRSRLTTSRKTTISSRLPSLPTTPPIPPLVASTVGLSGEQRRSGAGEGGTPSMSSFPTQRSSGAVPASPNAPPHSAPPSRGVHCAKRGSELALVRRFPSSAREAGSARGSGRKDSKGVLASSAKLAARLKTLQHRWLYEDDAATALKSLSELVKPQPTMHELLNDRTTTAGKALFEPVVFDENFGPRAAASAGALTTLAEICDRQGGEGKSTSNLSGAVIAPAPPQPETSEDAVISAKAFTNLRYDAEKLLAIAALESGKGGGADGRGGDGEALVVVPPHRLTILRPSVKAQAVALQPTHVPSALVRRWIGYLRGEQATAEQNHHLAEVAFREVIARSPICHLVLDTNDDRMTNLAMRTAVSCMVLEETVHLLPRHQAILAPYLDMLLRYALVPDTPSMRQALGTVSFPELFDALESTIGDVAYFTSTADERNSTYGQRSSHSNVGGARRSSPSIHQAYSGGGSGRPRRKHTLGMSELGTGIDEVPLERTPEEMRRDAIMQLLTPYARKPFFVAHLELSRRVVAMAHHVRSRQLHFRRLTTIFELTLVNWSKTLLRAVVRAWKRLCAERRHREQRHRARFANRWSSERLRAGVQRWRSFAAFTMQSAEADNAAKVRISEKKDAIARYHTEIDGLLRTSRELSVMIEVKQSDHEVLVGKIEATEASYTDLLHRVRVMDMVGTEVLTSVLVEEPIPIYTAPELVGDPLLHNRVAVLPMAVSWANHMLHRHGQNTEELCDMSPDKAAAHRKRQKAEMERLRAQQMSSTRDLVQLADGVGAASTTTTEAASASQGSPDREVAKGGDSAGGEEQHKPQQGGGKGAEGGEAQTAATAEEEEEVELIFDDLLESQRLSPTVFIPLYKFLVLMRCMEDEENPNVPSIEVVRMVKTVDKEVMEELQIVDEEVRQANASTSGGSPLTAILGAAAGGGPSSATELLTDEMRDAAADVCRILVDSYERITELPCVVTADQIFSRERGPLLVFLSGLMRHFSNWYVRRARTELGAFAVMPELTERNGGPILASGALEEAIVLAKARAQGGEAAFTGRRHAKYSEWYYPPTNHLRWQPLVDSQQQWVAGSVGALHSSLLIATAHQRSHHLSVVEQDSASHLLRQLSLANMMDLLPNVQVDTARYYMENMKSIERFFPQLRQIFRLYGLSSTELRAASNGVLGDPLFLDPNAGGGALSERKPFRSNDGVDPEDDLAVRTEPDAGWYVSANSFWKLLQDAGLAGGSTDPAGSGDGTSKSTHHTTLNRVAVFCVVEHVVFRELLAARKDGGMAAAGDISSSDLSPTSSGVNQPVLSSTFSQTQPVMGEDSSTITAAVSAAAVVEEEAEEESRANKEKPIAREVQLMQLASGRPVAYFARAVQEQRHVDLRGEKGTLCMNLAQFTEALIRCAHAWQCASCSQNPHARNVLGAKLSPNPSSAGLTTLAIPTAAAASTTSHSRVHYLGSNYDFPLHPAALDLFLGDWLVPRLLGARSSLPAFRLSLRRRPVQLFFAVHQERLHEVYARYVKAREAVGARSSLPSPYAHVLTIESRPLEVGESEAIGTLKAAQQAYSHSSSVHASAPLAKSGAAPRDVGIVAVLTFSEVMVMAKELLWLRQRRITESALRHCYRSVVGDSQREGEVLFFPEFLDFLCAVSYYYDTDPLKSLEEKVVPFVEKRVLIEPR